MKGETPTSLIFFNILATSDLAVADSGYEHQTTDTLWACSEKRMPQTLVFVKSVLLSSLICTWCYYTHWLSCLSCKT